jgi:hypothetical protein
MARNQAGIVLAPYLIAFVIGAIAIALVYGYGRKAGEKSVRLEWEQAVRDQREQEMNQAGKASTGLENSRAKRQVVTRTITETVEKIIDRPVYRNVCIDADGLCLLNAAINGKGSDSCKPDGSLSRPTTTQGRNGGVGLTLGNVNR